MSRFVLDASVLMKWYVPEDGSEAALAYLDPAHESHLPSLLFAEVANILWKKVARAEISTDDARRIIAEILQAPLVVHPIEPLTSSALNLALATGRSAYDSMYLALAEAMSLQVVSADRRLSNALANSARRSLVRWFEVAPDQDEVR